MKEGETFMMCFVTALMDLKYPDCISMADDSPTFTIPVAKVQSSPTIWSTIAQTHRILRSKVKATKKDRNLLQIHTDSCKTTQNPYSGSQDPLRLKQPQSCSKKQQLLASKSH